MKSFRSLADARLHKNMSQVQLSFASGVPLSSVQKYERGVHQPTVEAALALCAALGLTVEQVFLPNSSQEILKTPAPLEEVAA